MNDAISASKQVSIISQTNVSVEAHNGLAESLSKMKTIDKSGVPVDIILKDYSVDDQIFNVYCFPYDSYMYYDSKIFLAPLAWSDERVTAVNNVFVRPYKIGGFSNRNAYDTTEPEDVTYYRVPIRTTLASANLS